MDESLTETNKRISALLNEANNSLASSNNKDKSREIDRHIKQVKAQANDPEFIKKVDIADKFFNDKKLRMNEIISILRHFRERYYIKSIRVLEKYSAALKVIALAINFDSWFPFLEHAVPKKDENMHIVTLNVKKGTQFIDENDKINVIVEDISYTIFVKNKDPVDKKPSINEVDATEISSLKVGDIKECPSDSFNDTEEIEFSPPVEEE